jgi:hypothetical protein
MAAAELIAVEVSELLVPSAVARLSSDLGTDATIVRVDGDARDWAAADRCADDLARLAAITVGVCNPERAPAIAVKIADHPTGALLACDLSLRIGGPEVAGAWNHVAADEQGAEDWLQALAEAISVAPLAALATTRLLRLVARASTSDALAAEAITYSLLQAGPEHRAWLRERPV